MARCWPVYSCGRVNQVEPRALRPAAADVRGTRPAPHAATRRPASRAQRDDGASDRGRPGHKSAESAANRLTRDRLSQRAATGARRPDRHAAAQRRRRPVRNESGSPSSFRVPAVRARVGRLSRSGRSDAGQTSIAIAGISDRSSRGAAARTVCALPQTPLAGVIHAEAAIRTRHLRPRVVDRPSTLAVGVFAVFLRHNPAVPCCASRGGRVITFELHGQGPRNLM
jgi:hypothetical protein